MLVNVFFLGKLIFNGTVLNQKQIAALFVA